MLMQKQWSNAASEENLLDHFLCEICRFENLYAEFKKMYRNSDQGRKEKHIGIACTTPLGQGHGHKT